MIKFFAATALPISFLAMHQEKTAATADILEVWLDGRPGSDASIRLYLTEIMELLPSGESCENF